MPSAKRLQVLSVERSPVLFDVVDVQEPVTLVPFLSVQSKDAGVAVALKYVETDVPPGGGSVERGLHHASRL